MKSKTKPAPPHKKQAEKQQRKQLFNLMYHYIIFEKVRLLPTKKL